MLYYNIIRYKRGPLQPYFYLHLIFPIKKQTLQLFTPLSATLRVYKQGLSLLFQCFLLLL